MSSTPADATPATADDARRLAAASFRPSRQRLIGAEVEFLVFDSDDFGRHVAAEAVAEIADVALPGGGTITIEPGGQLELVTRPFAGPWELVAAMGRDIDVLVERFSADGLDLVSLGLDPIRPPQRSLDVARYEEMERFFAARSPAGRDMMTRTASLQLNIDFGPEPATTWRHAVAIAPFLNAAFANSPTTDGRDRRPVSHRQRIWATTDTTRTRPLGPDPADWCDYILDAQMFSHVEDCTCRDWLRQPTAPTIADLERHITTLFPPLRPRGFVELRMLDALPAAGRTAAIATVWTLLTDPDAGASAAAQCESVDDPWGRALGAGLGDETVRAVSDALVDIAASRMDDQAPDLADACRGWRQGRDRTGPPWRTAAELIAGSVEPRGDEM